MTPSQQAYYESLQAELNEIELQQQDTTLPHSDQQMLDQAWEEIQEKIEELEEMLEPVRIAPPPPKMGDSRGILMLTPDGRWVQAPPLPIRPVRVCNCDSDGECVYCEEERLAEEEQERVNAWVDDREDCSRCAGCYYCMDGPSYDGADEV
jgi:hypothetical protein